MGAAVFAVYASGQSGRIDATLARTATQSAAVAQGIKLKSAQTGTVATLSAPVSMGEVLLQLFPQSITPGTDTDVGLLTVTDAAVAAGDADGYFSDITIHGADFRAYTTHMAGTAGGLVRAIYPRSAAVADRWRLGLLIAVLAVGLGVATGLAARALAGRALTPLRRATATADHVRRTGRLDERLDATGSDEVAALARAFNDMLAALDESVTAQRRLVADASHELRTPLTSIVTNLDLLEEEPGLADPVAPELIRRARQQSDELRQLVDDIIELARQGQVTPVLVPTRLDLLAAGVVDRARRRAGSVPIAMRGEACPVIADEDALSRAIDNLVSNAVAWTPPGGSITVTTGHDLRECWVEVADTGPGISSEDQPHVFERFYRASAARAKPGSGLGLAIVAQVAALHGGRARVVPGTAGAHVRLSLPRAPARQLSGTDVGGLSDRPGFDVEPSS